METKNINDWKNKKFHYKDDKIKIVKMLKDFIGVNVVIEDDATYKEIYEIKIIKIGIFNKYINYIYRYNNEWKESTIEVSEFYLYRTLIDVFE